MHNTNKRVSQGAWVDLALHTLGWKAFQDLCAHVCEEMLQRPVEIYREAQDGGQDAVFLSKKRGKKATCPATIQCKFSAKAGNTLSLSDLTRESSSISALVKSGEANTYILMTNMSSSAMNAKIIKDYMRTLGVNHPHVFAKEWITRAIRSSPRLRALVPRIYGLGDLSIILDERRAEQTRALLGHMLPTLKVYVPTKPHVKAVRSISEHGITLLLGGPGVGKSTIAAILSTIASENKGYTCYKVDSPHELPDNWNPQEGESFFWIDDAFGPNQLRQDYVDRWIQIMPRIQAAIAGGSKFVLTSRSHIYEAAAPKLGSRNHPSLREEDAVVHVGALTRDEKRQILYNHIKSGNQPSSWKAAVKPFLDHLTSEPSFLAEIARRLGDQSYTKKLEVRLETLTKFMREPQEHLVQTINELSKVDRAALTLVFLHRSKMPVDAPIPELQQLVVTHFGVANEELGQAIAYMQDSFVSQGVEGFHRFWTFKHPTISDALSAILSKTPGMSELYIRGVKPLTLLSEVVSHGVADIKDAIFVGEKLNAVLAKRLTEVPDNNTANRALFSFLAERANDEVLSSAIQQDSSLLDRTAYVSHWLGYDPKLRVYARAMKLGLLPDRLREIASLRLEKALTEDFDVSFLDDKGILAIIPPKRLMRLPIELKKNFDERIRDKISEIVDGADLDIEPADNFEDLTSAVSRFEELFDDDVDALGALSDAANSISDGVREISDKKEQMDMPTSDEWDWEELGNSTARASKSPKVIDAGDTGIKARSMFSDVEE